MPKEKSSWACYCNLRHSIEVFPKRSVPVFHLVAVEQYGYDNYHDNNGNNCDDCCYVRAVSNFAWNKHRRIELLFNRNVLLNIIDNLLFS